MREDNYEATPSKSMMRFDQHCILNHFEYWNHGHVGGGCAGPGKSETGKDWKWACSGQ